MPSRYYVKQADDVIYRRRDGRGLADAPPDEMLWELGWVPLSRRESMAREQRRRTKGQVTRRLESSLMFNLVEVDEVEAKRVARIKGLPTADW